MGVTILEYVLQRLKEAGFSAAAAYPGQKFPQLTHTAAAVHIQNVDRAGGTVTVEVCILSPAALGGTACETAALAAVEALQASQAVCTQSGCVYDSSAQVYRVSILATYTGAATADDCTVGPGFTVSLNGNCHSWAVRFSEEKIQEQTAEFEARSPVATAITPGCFYWNITLEEQFPQGFPETQLPEAEFQLQLTRDSRSDLYSPCRWTSVTRTFTPEGLRRISKGIALTREEAEA